jgi:hypothetical protein
MLRRKAAKRTLPFDLAAEELLVSQAEDNPARKKPRLEEPLPTLIDQAARKTDSPDLSLGLPPLVADNDDTNANPMADTSSNAGASTWATARWTTEEDAKLTSAVASTSKKKWGKEYKTDWDAVAALVLLRTKKQCWDRWHNVLNPSIDRANGRTGKWTAVEGDMLKDAVQRHGGKDWGAVAALVPGRTKNQCRSRWHNTLNLSIALAAGREGKWAEDEDIKLKDAVQMHGGMNWGAITALVPGRTRSQCKSRWYNALNPNIDRANVRKGK